MTCTKCNDTGMIPDPDRGSGNGPYWDSPCDCKDRARYDGTTGEPPRTHKPGNFDKGELQGYFAHLYTRDFDELVRLRKENRRLQDELERRP